MKVKYAGILWDERYDNASTETRVFVPEADDQEKMAEAICTGAEGLGYWSRADEDDREYYRAIAKTTMDMMGWWWG